MRSLVQFAAFQALWFGAVLGATHGFAWLGPALLVPYLLLHRFALRLELSLLGRALGLGLVGTLVDGLLAGVGILSHAGRDVAWPGLLAPPWIAALWIAFALLPSVSLAWLVRRPRLACLLGAIGGPLSALGGARLGALVLEEPQARALIVLALEYALATPVLLTLSARRAR